MAFYNYICKLDENNNLLKVLQEHAPENQQEDKYFKLENNERVPFVPIVRGKYTGKWYIKDQYDEDYENQYHFNDVKQRKISDNDRLCFDHRISQHITVNVDGTSLEFETSRRTYLDLQAVYMSLVRNHQRKWIDENRKSFVFTDVKQVENILNQIDDLYDNAYETWDNYCSAIENAQTVEELEAIKIEYKTNEKVEESPAMFVNPVIVDEMPFDEPVFAQPVMPN